MRKRILSMLLACVMMITLFQVNVFAYGTGSRFGNCWGPYVSSEENCFVVFTDQDFCFMYMHIYMITNNINFTLEIRMSRIMPRGILMEMVI